MKYTNDTGISLSMAVWLAADLYDHNSDPNTISVTSLIRPVKQIVLAGRVPPGENSIELSGLVKAQSGTAVHTAVEVAWLEHYERAMLKLGYPQDIIDKIRINPTTSDMDNYRKAEKKVIPIYLERRSEKTINGMNVSGKFDLVVEGNLEDVKNTSTFTYVKKSNDLAYKLQGSIYRWLNQDIITGDFITIQYIFTDWNAYGYKQNPNNYPPHAQMAYKVPLMTIEETEAYVSNRIDELKLSFTKTEDQMTPCTREELWQDATVWKYYKDPSKLGRSTKNFPDHFEATARLVKDGSVGTILEVPGQVKACKYCSGFAVCQQKETYLANGSLKI